MNIKQKMTELVEYFKENKFNGIHVNLCPEIPEHWHYEYAIAQDLHYDDSYGCENSYFDHEKIQYDLEQFIRDWFKGDAVVKLYWEAQELEVYRKNTKTLRLFQKINVTYQTLSENDQVIVDVLNNNTIHLENFLYMTKRCLPHMEITIEDNYIIGTVTKNDKRYKLFRFHDISTFTGEVMS